MHVGISTDIGKLREVNQDSYYVSEKEDIPVFIIADGMGGHRAGEVASKMAIDVMKERFFKSNKSINEEREVVLLVKKAIETANLKIYESSQKNKEYLGMGTTITMTYILGDKIVVGHIGDSRAYLLREGKFSQLTEDHSLVAQLLKNGSISEAEAQSHPQKNVITRAVGTDEEIDIDIVVEKIYKEDIVLLCTDGLTNMVDDSQINEILSTRKDIQTACDDLVELANQNGGYDNITVIAIKIV